jgi:hypothetical protein
VLLSPFSNKEKLPLCVGGGISILSEIAVRKIMTGLIADGLFFSMQ